MRKDGLLKSARCIRETKTTMTAAETFNYDSQIRHTTIDILGEKEEILIGNTLHSFTTTNTHPASTDWETSAENPHAQSDPDQAAGALFQERCTAHNSTAPIIDRISTQAGPWRFYSEPKTLTYKWVQYALLSHIGMYRTLSHKIDCTTCIMDFNNNKYQQKIYCINCSSIRNPLSFNDPSLQKIFNFSQEGERDHLYSNNRKSEQALTIVNTTADMEKTRKPRIPVGCDADIDILKSMTFNKFQNQHPAKIEKTLYGNMKISHEKTCYVEKLKTEIGWMVNMKQFTHKNLQSTIRVILITVKAADKFLSLINRKLILRKLGTSKTDSIISIGFQEDNIEYLLPSIPHFEEEKIGENRPNVFFGIQIKDKKL